MTIEELFNATPRDYAMRHYSVIYDSFATREQEYRTTVPDIADDVGKVAFLFLRAYTAEMRDPTPGGRAALVCCASCAVYRALPGEAKPVPQEERVA